MSEKWELLSASSRVLLTKYDRMKFSVELVGHLLYWRTCDGAKVATNLRPEKIFLRDFYYVSTHSCYCSGSSA